MAKEAYQKKIFTYTFENLEIFFKFGNSVFYSTKKLTKLSENGEMHKARVFEMISKCNLKDYDSPPEISRNIRSEVLVIQDIVSFFIGIPLTVYHESSHESKFEKIEYAEQKTKLIIEGKDYTKQLEVLLEKINVEGNLIVSLLDRWRKANYLKRNSADANLYHDEAILNYFHIIELFAENCNDELKNKLDNRINDFLSNYYKENFDLNDEKIKVKIKDGYVVMYEILIRKELTLFNKIIFFLKKYNLFDKNLEYYINNLIEIRNSIAHGRLIYQKKLLWPLPPFFCLARESFEILDSLQIFTGKMISSYLGIECWHEEWEECKSFFLPPDDILSGFLKNHNEFPEINKNTLCNGNSKNITWKTIFYHYIKNSKKFSIKRVSEVLKSYFIETEISEKNANDLFNISVIFADADDKNIEEKAKDNIQISVKNNWHKLSNIKDLYGYLEYHGLSPIWYEKFIENSMEFVKKE